MTALSILQISDLHILPESHNTLLGVNTEYYFNAVLELALKNHHPFDLILVTGDIAQDPCLKSYQRIIERLNKTNIPCLCLPGNHDDLSLMQQVFNSAQVNCQKQLLLNNWQIINLNSQIIGESGGYLNAIELSFLKDCLIQHPNHHALIAVHHHCIPTQSAWLDTMIIKNNTELLDIVTQFTQLKLIISGHIHQELDLTIGNIRVLGTPSTCFQFSPLSQTFNISNEMPGYRLIKLEDNGCIETEVKRLAGVLTKLDLKSKGY